MSSTLTVLLSGVVGISPQVLFLETDETLGEITAAGYLNPIASSSAISISVGDAVLVQYSGQTQGNWFYPTISSGVITLVPGGSGTITGGTSLGGTDAIYAGVTGTNLTFKGLTAGSNITLTPSGTGITIAASGGGSNYEYTAEYWVDANGSNSNTGTSINEPWQTLTYAAANAAGGSIVNLMGDFSDSATITFTASLTLNGPAAYLAGTYINNAPQLNGFVYSVMNYTDNGAGPFGLNAAVMENYVNNTGGVPTYVSFGELTGTNSCINAATVVFDIKQLTGTLVISGCAININNDVLITGSISNTAGSLNGFLNATVPGLQANSQNTGPLTIGTTTTAGSFYTLPATDGTNGQTLITNGTGTVSWGAGGGGGNFTYTQALWVSQNNGSDSNAGTSINTPFLTVQNAINVAGTNPTIIYVVDANNSNTEAISTTGAGQQIYIDAPGTEFQNTITQASNDEIILNCALVDGFITNSASPTIIDGGNINVTSTSTGQISCTCYTYAGAHTGGATLLLIAQDMSFLSLDAASTAYVDAPLCSSITNAGTLYIWTNTPPGTCLASNTGNIQGVMGGVTFGTAAVCASTASAAAYTFPSVDGSNQQVLQTNGSGTVTWQTLTGTDFEYAAQYWVTATGNDANTGTSINEPFATLQNAITVAGATPTTINYMDQSNGETITINAAQNININALQCNFGGTFTSSGNLIMLCAGAPTYVGAVTANLYVVASQNGGYISGDLAHLSIIAPTVGTINLASTTQSHTEIICNTIGAITYASTGNSEYIQITASQYTGNISLDGNAIAIMTGASNAAVTITNAGYLSASITGFAAAVPTVANTGTIQGMIGNVAYGATGFAGTSGSTAAYTLPTTDGTIGQVLTTNGSGFVSWA